MLVLLLSSLVSNRLGDDDGEDVIDVSEGVGDLLPEAVSVLASSLVVVVASDFLLLLFGEWRIIRKRRISSRI